MGQRERKHNQLCVSVVFVCLCVCGQSQHDIAPVRVISLHSHHVVTLVGYRHVSDTDTCVQYLLPSLARRRSRSTTTPGTKQFVWLERRVYSHGNVGDQGSLFVPRGCHAARPLARVRMVIIQEGRATQISNIHDDCRFLSLRLILVYSWLQTNDQRVVI